MNRREAGEGLGKASPNSEKPANGSDPFEFGGRPSSLCYSRDPNGSLGRAKIQTFIFDKKRKGLAKQLKSLLAKG